MELVIWLIGQAWLNYWSYLWCDNYLIQQNECDMYQVYTIHLLNSACWIKSLSHSKYDQFEYSFLPICVGLIKITKRIVQTPFFLTFDQWSIRLHQLKFNYLLRYKLSNWVTVWIKKIHKIYECQLWIFSNFEDQSSTYLFNLILYQCITLSHWYCNHVPHYSCSLHGRSILVMK
jgi:hypothetical protein